MKTKYEFLENFDVSYIAYIRDFNTIGVDCRPFLRIENAYGRLYTSLLPHDFVYEKEANTLYIEPNTSIGIVSTFEKSALVIKQGGLKEDIGIYRIDMANNTNPDDFSNCVQELVNKKSYYPNKESALKYIYEKSIGPLAANNNDINSVPFQKFFPKDIKVAKYFNKLSDERRAICHFDKNENLPL